MPFLIAMLVFDSCKEDEIDSLPIEIQHQITHVSEYKGNDGFIDIYVTGGIEPYSYLWSNGKTTQDVDSLAAGLYNVCISDFIGTTKTDTFEVFQPLPDSLALSKIIVNVSAHGLNDGKIDITVTGGVPPYTFLWSSGETSKNIIALVSGNYTITITDAVGTIISDSIQISQPSPTPLALLLTGKDISEYGKSDGAVYSTVTGGVQPFTYEWSNGATTSNIENLQPGTYQLTVSDELGTSVYESVNLTEPAPDALVFSIESVVHPSETGASDGEIHTAVSGGYPPYSFEWSNGETTQNLSNIPAGTYSVTLSDIGGQSQTEMVALIDSVYDYDGNAYSFIKIGEQFWMQQNLRVTHAPDGAEITSYAYNNIETNVEIYGRLYTWYAAMNGSEIELAQGICPQGWHLPSDEEFKILEMELGMTREEADRENTWRGRNVGTKLKVNGSSGYNAMLSGRRSSTGRFELMGNSEYVWTSNFYDNNYAWRRCLCIYDNTVGRWNTFPKNYGFSVRCVKNVEK